MDRARRAEEQARAAQECAEATPSPEWPGTVLDVRHQSASETESHGPVGMRRREPGAARERRGHP
jgi:hypothetical protein